MIFLFTFSTVIFIIVILIVVCATFFGLAIDSWWAAFTAFIIDVIAVFVMKYIMKLALKKYNKTIDKMNYDIHAFLDEQYKFLDRPLLSAYVRNLVKSNIAVGYIHNEQYDEALKIYTEFESSGYQNITPAMRFIILNNQSGAYLRIGDIERARLYMQNAEAILRTANAPQTVMQSFYSLFQLTVATFNFVVNKNEQTAMEYLNKLQASLSAFSSKDIIKTSELRIHYEMGVAYIALGNEERANSEFDIVLQSGASIPFVERIKVYRKTGDLSVLKV